MRKNTISLRIMIILLLLPIVIFTACGNRKVVYFNNAKYTLSQSEGNVKIYKTIDGVKLTIEKSNGKYIVNDGRENYIVSGDYNRVEVQYPNGEKSWMSYSDSSNGVSFSAGGSPVEGYPSVDDFRYLVFSSSKGSGVDGGQIFLALIIIIVSIVSIKNPKLSWFLDKGWKFKNAEPSDAYLGLTQVGGVIGIIIGIIVLLSSCAA